MKYMWNGAEMYPMMRLVALAGPPGCIISIHNQIVIYYRVYTKYNVWFGLITPINPVSGFSRQVNFNIIVFSKNRPNPAKQPQRNQTPGVSRRTSKR